LGTSKSSGGGQLFFPPVGGPDTSSVMLCWQSLPSPPGAGKHGSCFLQAGISRFFLPMWTDPGFFPKRESLRSFWGPQIRPSPQWRSSSSFFRGRTEFSWARRSFSFPAASWGLSLLHLKTFYRARRPFLSEVASGIDRVRLFFSFLKGKGFSPGDNGERPVFFWEAATCFSDTSTTNRSSSRRGRSGLSFLFSGALSLSFRGGFFPL